MATNDDYGDGDGYGVERAVVGGEEWWLSLERVFSLSYRQSGRLGFRGSSVANSPLIPS